MEKGIEMESGYIFGLQSTVPYDLWTWVPPREYIKLPKSHKP